MSLSKAISGLWSMGGVSERSNKGPLLRRKNAIKLSQIFPMISATMMEINVLTFTPIKQ